MVNWRDEFKKYIVKKFNKQMGLDIDANNITQIVINTNFNIGTLSIKELSLIYAFALMDENYEQAQKIVDEFTKRNCKVSIDINEEKNEAIINLYMFPKTTVAYLDIKMKVLPDGMIIDFEKENL
jgi:hypothetical protein